MRRTKFDEEVTDFLVWVEYIRPALSRARVVDTSDGMITAKVYPIGDRRFWSSCDIITFPAYFLELDDDEALDTWISYIIETGLTDVIYPTDTEDVDSDDYDILDSYY